MKHLCFLLLLVNFSLTGQTNLLYGNWWLTEIHTNQNTLIPPPNPPQMLEGTLNIYNDNNTPMIMANYWEGLNSSITLLNENPNYFRYGTMMITLPGACPFAVLAPLNAAYRDFYVDNTNQNLNYEITPQGNNLTLKVTDSNGNYLLYSNVSLSANQLHSATISIGPNPAQDRVQVQGLDAPFDAELYSLSGQKLMTIQQMDPNQPIDVSALPQGCYQMIIRQGQNRWVKKLVRG